MTTFVLIHGAGDSGYAWHLLERELRARGHATVAPDLPSAEDDAGFDDYATAVVEAIGRSGAPTDDVVVVGHSLGGFTAPMVAERLGADQLVLLAAMVANPGEVPDGWWESSGYTEVVRVQRAADGGLTDNPDELVSFYNGVPEGIARDAQAHAQRQSEAPMHRPWPMAAWPDLPTRFILCRDDRFFPAALFRRLVPERLGIRPEEIDGGHCVMLGDPVGLADALIGRSAETSI